MSSRNLAVEHLTADNRRLVESWLTDFDVGWHDNRLAEQITALPGELTLRWPLLLGLVGIDLQHRWRIGQVPLIDEYLDRFPELGSRDSVPISLLHAEYMARLHAGGPPSWAEYQQRFPYHVEELRNLIGPGEAETAPPDAFATLPMDSPREAPAPFVPALAPEPSRQPESANDFENALPALGERVQKVPEQLGRYRILRKLGKGGMGAVYLALDTQLDREVALKVPNFKDDEDEDNLKRFFREARAAAKIEHPNICPIYDVGEIDGIRYLTMAYVKGKPLSAFLQLDKPIKVTHAVAVVRKLALALSAAHQKGIVHRDLKPANIMLNQQSEPILLDFGMAREVFSDQARLTQYGNLVGTPAYMSPEQVKGDLNALGPNCDIYALGVILYQLLTGHLPYEGETFTVLAKLLTQDPTPPQQHRPHLDDDICRICLKAMAREVTDRYQLMAEFAHALTGYLRKHSRSSQEQAPKLRDATPNRPREKEPVPPNVNADGTLDLIYFESMNPGMGGLLERSPAIARPQRPSNTLPAPVSPPPFPAPAPVPARQTMLAAQPAPQPLDAPALTLPQYWNTPAEASVEPEHEPAASGDYTRLIWILGSAALGLLLLLVVVLVLLLTRQETPPDKAKNTRPASTSQAAVPTQPIEWRAFSPPEGRCAVEMPGAPRVDDEGRRQYFTEVNRVRYSLFWGDQEGNFNTVGDALAVLHRERDRILQQLPGSQLVKEDKITLDGHEGRQWEVLAPAQQAKFIIRCYQVRQRQYLLYVSFPLTMDSQVQSKRFFDSFRLQ